MARTNVPKASTMAPLAQRTHCYTYIFLCKLEVDIKGTIYNTFYIFIRFADRLQLYTMHYSF